MRKRVGYFFVIFLLAFIISLDVIYSGGSGSVEDPDGILYKESTYATNSFKKLNEISESLKTIAKKEDFAGWFTGVIALLLGLAGIFGLQEIIKNRWYKPNLKVSIKLETPDCLKIDVTDTQTGQFLYEAYYLRFKIENNGNYRMEDVEVFAMELYKKGNNQRYSKISSFQPMNLRWANVGEVTLPKIQPGLHKHCDFGHVIQNPSPYQNQNTILSRFGLLQKSNVVFILETQVTPNTGSNYLLPDEYRIKLAFAANNLKPKFYFYKFKIADRWSRNEHQMLTNNISVSREA